MTNRESISRLRKIFKEIHADSKFSAKLAFSILLSISKVLIKKDSERLKIMSQSHLFKKLKCVEVIEAPTIDPCCGIKSFCTVYRTKNKLPKIHADTYGPIIRDIYSIDGNKTITLIQAQDYLRLIKNPWNKQKKDLYAFWAEDYLYFPNGAWKMVEIEAFWAENIKPFSTCNDEEDCVKFLDQDFAIPGYYEADLFRLAETEIKGTYASVPDKSNEINKSDSPSTIQS